MSRLLALTSEAQRTSRPKTWKSKLEYNNETRHEILIPNMLYSPAVPLQLLSPRIWGQQNKDLNGHSALFNMAV